MKNLIFTIFLMILFSSCTADSIEEGVIDDQKNPSYQIESVDLSKGKKRPGDN